MIIANTPEEKKEWFEACFGGIQSCKDHEVDFDPATVAEVLVAGGSGLGPDNDRWFMVRLNSGTYATGWDTEDYTGHGCQCGGGMAFFDEPFRAYKMGLSLNVREALGPTLSGMFNGEK